MTERGILAGLYLGDHYPELSDAILVCATEMRTDDDIDLYTNTLASVLNELGGE